VQATVARFDPRTTSGEVVTDTGLLLPFGPEAFSTSGLRHVRAGQRLTVSLEGAGAAAVVVAMRLETVGVVPGRRSLP
jgi:2-phospho-L-lactate/phosphoenolpyruvate guanylyltransferase